MSPTSTTSLNDADGEALHHPRRDAFSPHGELTEEWVRLPKPGHFLLGLGRTFLFQLSKSGKIKTVALYQPGKTRGVRLVFLPSVRAFIEAEATRQNRSSL